MNARHRKTLQAVFAKSTAANVLFSSIESLFVALGGSVLEREGSRVRISFGDEHWHCHRPHPGKEARRYQVEEARELSQRLEIKP